METPPRKAQDLREALNRLDPERPLSTSEELDAYFVARPHSPVDELAILLTDTDRPQKLLFTGHRGSGKSTELARLTNEIGDDFLVVRYSVQSVLNLFDLRYVDVVLSLGLELIEQATELDVEVDEAVLEHILKFANDITREVVAESRSEASVKGTLNFVVSKLSSKLRTEDVTREKVRENVQSRISDLLESIELLTKEMERQTGRQLLVIIEDLDKADLGTAKRLFYEHATSLRAPPLSIIYTFPTALRHENSFIQVKNNFADVYVLPNMKTRTKDGSPFAPGIDTVQNILKRRVEEGVFAPEAMEKLAEYSSGIPRELIALGRQACLEARKKQQDAVDAEAVERAAQRRRLDYEVLLKNEQLKLLARVHKIKDVNNDERYHELLHNLSVLEYRNGRPWYDVHPLVLPLLPDETDGDSD